MHQAESPCIDSIVLDTPWRRRSNTASRAVVELRDPGTLAAPESAAIFQTLAGNDEDGDEGAGVKRGRVREDTPPASTFLHQH